MPIEVLVPVAEVTFAELRMPERVQDLNGKRTGLLWTQKVNGDILLRHLEEALKKEYRLSGTSFEKKPLASSAAPPEILERLSAESDLVILAMGD